MYHQAESGNFKIGRLVVLIRDDRHYLSISRNYQFNWGCLMTSTLTQRQAAKRWKERNPEKVSAQAVLQKRRKSCVNPTHLEAVTPQENEWRAWMKRAGLSIDQIRSLKEWMTKNLTQEQLDVLWSTYRWNNGRA